MRLQRFLALHSALGSRRFCEELIRSGAVRVNGEVARIGRSVDPARDEVMVDGRKIVPKLAFTYLLYNKPAGVLCTFGESDVDGPRRVTLADVLRERRLPVRLFSIGRLDLDAEGLLILTDDGDLAARLSHPRTGISRVYQVGLERPLSAEDVDRLQRLKKIPPLFHPQDKDKRNYKKRAESISPPRILEGVGRRHVLIKVKEGRNREVKRIFAEVRHRVTHLRRVGFGPIKLGNLPPGALRPLGSAEIEHLRTA